MVRLLSTGAFPVFCVVFVLCLGGIRFRIRAPLTASGQAGLSYCPNGPVLGRLLTEVQKGRGEEEDEEDEGKKKKDKELGQSRYRKTASRTCSRLVVQHLYTRVADSASIRRSAMIIWTSLPRKWLPWRQKKHPWRHQKSPRTLAMRIVTGRHG